MTATILALLILTIFRSIADECAGNECSGPDECCESAPFCFRNRCDGGSRSTDSTMGPTMEPTLGPIDIECEGNHCEDDDECCPFASWCFENRCYRAPGRPYNILNDETLHASIINKCDYDIDDKELMNDLLSEHASIGTFNKFSIELMNLGAPLWFIELSQKAGIDEINHTEIILNILNKNGSKECVEIGKFPNHEIKFNSDCNAISLDVVNGGCFGETESSINTMIKSIKIKELYSVSIDEIRHSALAWISAKWMINNCKNIKISDKEWWQNKLKQSGSEVINKIYQQFDSFKGNDYQNLYQIIHDILYDEVSSL